MMKFSKAQVIIIKSYFEKASADIVSLKDTDSKNFNKVLLWLSFIESIGFFNFNNKRSNKERFIKTLRDLCRWNYIDKVAHPLLWEYLIKIHPTETDLIDFLENDCWGESKKDPSNWMTPRDSPTFNDESFLRKMLFNQAIQITNFRLGDLLWRVRNMGIHGRLRCYSVELSTNELYFLCKYDPNEKDLLKYIWYLTLPEKFFSNLVENALNNWVPSELDISKEDELNKILLYNITF